MKVLVTGANGYIGSKVVTQLCNNGVVVIATDMDNSHIDKRAKYIKTNIFLDNDNWMSFFDNPDVCLHLAWRDGFVHNSKRHMEDISYHFKFLCNLIDNGIKTIAVMGSMHEIGYWEGAIDDKTPCNPSSQYGIAKNALRKSIELYCSDKKCNFMWLRAFYIYGNDEYGNSIFCKIRQAVKENKKSFPFTTGKNKYDFLNIDELTNQISACILQNEVLGIINCCSGIPVSLSKQIEWYIKVNKLPIKLDYGKYPDRKYDSPCIYGDDSKIKNIMRRKTKVLVTGANGQLGCECVNELKKRGYINIKAIDIEDLDLTNEEETNKFIYEYKPDIIMHNAAWTAVDKAEKYPDKVKKINSTVPLYLAKIANKINSKLVYISTDYVFDGLGDEPFETNHEKNGLSVYGKTKAEGEDNIINNCKNYFIVRTSWVFGNGKNFVKTMVDLSKSGKKEVNVVCDQIGSITYSKHLAMLLCDMIETNKYGIYHATNEGFISWADLAEKIFTLINSDIIVKRLTTEEYMKIVPNQTIRPLNSRLSKKSLDLAGFKRLPYWEDALKEYLKELI